MKQAITIVFASLLVSVSSVSADDDTDADVRLPVAVEKQLVLAGGNRMQIEAALQRVPDDQKTSMEFLVTHMPPADLRTLTADLLLENVRLAHKARAKSKWKISDELFLNDVLPYANVDETRESWRPAMFARASEIVKDCQTPGEAAQRLNQHLFKQVGVKYSTKRKKANQSPSESIDQGLASCTGLSILLVDACRSVNVPARIVGIPSWTTKKGNHTWVEIWDDGEWHFTGACEYSAKGLDKAWFIGDAAKANKQSRLNSIYAVSYQATDTKFPMVWSRDGPKSFAVNVTDRYSGEAKPVDNDAIELFIRVVSTDTGDRVKVPVTVKSADDANAKVHQGNSRDESADTNDILSFMLKRGKRYELAAPGLDGGSNGVLAFETGKKERQHLDIKVATDTRAVSKAEAAALVKKLGAEYLNELREDRKAEWEAKSIEIGDLKMKFDYRTFGDKPENGRSLFISMHGGGGAPPRVNEQQWKNQIKLYEPEEGIYLAPRAPTDTWNLWHEKHIDKFFARIIEDAIAIEDVDPNRVYIMGYSAGGDGVYQLAPRMADQLAAAAMMAGHPNGVSPLGLRNIGFTLHMGGKDGAYKRNQKASEWKEKLAQLKADDPGGYAHEVVIHPKFGHWMERKDAVAVPWMAKFTRDPLPKKVVWNQSGVTHDRYYWLAAEPDDRKGGAKMVVTRDGNEFEILETDKVAQVIIRLNDAMVDFEQPVVVKHDGKTQTFRVSRDAGLIKKTLMERGDIGSVFSAEIKINVDG